MPPVKGGSIAIWIHEIARRLAGSCEVVVYTRTAPFQKKVENEEGVHYRRFSTAADERLLGLLEPFSRFYKPQRPLFGSRWYYPAFARQVARDLRRQLCDIIHLHNLSNFVPVIRAYNPRARIVLHMHCEWLTQLDRTVIEPRLREVDLVLGCSEYITEKIRRGFPELADRCQTVFNGVDVPRFSANHSNGATRPAGEKRLLFVGRITPEKGLHVLLEALEKVLEREPHVRLEIVGPESLTAKPFLVGCSEDARVAALESFYEGSYLTRLREQAAARGLDGHISFTGFVPHARLPEHYHAADLLVNPSFSESFGMSLIEAMAGELPVVATRVGGMTGIVEQGKTGFLVEPGDAAALADAILRILSDNHLREEMKKAARERAVRLFSWDGVAESLLARYKELRLAHA